MSIATDNLNEPVAATPLDITEAGPDGSPSSRTTTSLPAAGTAARGFAWMISHALGNKLASIASQFVLAWFLTRDDFGLTGLALTVGVIANIFQQAGLKEALLRRATTLDDWMAPATWMSLLAGVATAAGTAAIAPVAAAVYGDARVVPLILLLSVASVFNGISVASQVKLQAESQFGRIALVFSATHIIQVLLSIVLALLGFGAYSIIIPFPVAAAARAVGFCAFAPVRFRVSPSFSQWKPLARDGVVVTAAALLAAMQSQGDYMILGATHDTKTVGVYYFAFNLSVQTVVLISVNLAYVALPTLASMQANLEHQSRVFLEATRMVAVIGVPLALLQAALAGPVLRLFFSPEWHDAIIVLQVLSVGMAFKLTGVLASNFFQARGRFVTHLWLTVTYTTVFLAAVGLASQLGGALSVAIAVSIVFVVWEPFTLLVAIKDVERPWRRLAEIFAFPLLAGTAAVGIGWMAGVYVGRLTESLWAQLAITAIVSSALYLGAALMFVRPAMESIRDRLGTLFRRRQAVAARI